MTHTNQQIEFEIISILIKKVISKYNETYKTNFKIVKFIYDEVVFAKISVSNYKLSDIFDLGYQFGSYAQLKRQQGEIDW